MKPAILFFVFSLSLLPLFSAAALAHCPLCSAATGALVATARVAGIDDAIVGTLIGAFTVSTAFWTSRIIEKRFRKRMPLQPYVISAVFIALTIAGFYTAGISGKESAFLNIMGLERLVFGMVLGGVASILSFEFHKLLRTRNGNTNYFPLQGVLVPLAIIMAVGLTIYVVIGV